MRGFIVLLFVGIAIGISYFNNEANYKSFLEFKTKFDKTYVDVIEEEKRFQIFCENLVIAKELNDKDTSAEYGVTKFMDLTRDEFKHFYLMSNFTSLKREGKDYPVLPQSTSLKRDAVPANFDWRDYNVVTGVYNQGQCGSCWAFSTTENVESMWARAGKGLLNLAVQQLVDCAGNGNEGCNGGNPPWTYPYIEAAGGMDSWASYPYTGATGACHFKPKDIVAKIESWGYVTANENEAYMMEWIYEYGPVSVCVDASEWQYYTGGVITGNCGNQIDHCVMVTGWTTDGITAWNVRNSWGTNWGYSGYLYVAYGGNICDIAEEVTSSVI